MVLLCVVHLYLIHLSTPSWGRRNSSSRGKSHESMEPSAYWMKREWGDLKPSPFKNFYHSDPVPILLLTLWTGKRLRIRSNFIEVCPRLKHLGPSTLSCASTNPCSLFPKTILFSFCSFSLCTFGSLYPSSRIPFPLSRRMPLFHMVLQLRLTH